MIARVGLLVEVQEFVAWADHERGPELHGAVTGLVLAIPLDERPASGQERVGTDERCRLEAVHLDDLCRFALFVDQDGEWHPFVFYEGLCVPFPSGSNSGHTDTGHQKIVVPVADLTGPFPAGQSAEVAQEEEDMALIGPQITKAVWCALGVEQR